MFFIEENLKIKLPHGVDESQFFKMQGKGCSLAVRINNHSYFVDNANIDQFGDAHSDEGFCNAIRKANVTGKIVNDRFVVSTFELIDKK